MTRARHRTLALRFVGPAVAASALLLFGLLSLAEEFSASDTIPAYVHRPGAGSRVDVRADGLWAGSAWTVTFTRNLTTGDDLHDIQFAPGGTFDFQVATWNNAGGTGHDTSAAVIVYQMTIPAAPGPLVFSGVPSLFSALSGEYLASNEIRIVATWSDATKNDRRKEWSFDGSDWSQSSDNEDRVAFLWDMQHDAFGSAGTCATMCHAPDMYTAAGTFVDVWHWKATRTNPSGYSDDKWWNDGAGGTASGRHSDPGMASYRDNTGAPPAFMAQGDPGASAAFLFEVAEGTRESTAYAAGAWGAGDVLAGYVHRRGSGSRVDVRATGSHDGSSWTVMFRRKLDTGDPFGDILFVPGATHSYQVALFDNAGGMSHETSQSSTVFTMMIPLVPGPLVFATTPGNLTSISGELLSSDEITITVVWSDASRDDARKQWSHNGSVWSQSSANEDRIAIIWDMQNDGFTSSGTCLSMCHVPNMSTAIGTFVDTWHWKARRTGATGFCDDKHWDDGSGNTASGRHSDAGTSVYKDNASNGGAPTYMSAGGVGDSATGLFEHAAASGLQRAVTFDPGFVQPSSTVTSAKLKLKFSSPLSDKLKLKGRWTSSEGLPSILDGQTGTFRAGNYMKTFTLDRKGRSRSDPIIKVKIDVKKAKWKVQVKNVNLQDGLGVSGDGGGIPREINWTLSLDNGWRISGTISMTGSVSVKYSHGGGGSPLKMKFKYMSRL